MWNGLLIDLQVFFFGGLQPSENVPKKKLNFLILKMLFEVLTPIFEPQRAPNFMKTYMELVLILVNLQQESRISALRSSCKIIKTILKVGQKTGFFKFWAPEFFPIFTIFVLNTKCTSIHVHFFFCGSTLRISSVFS